MSGEPDLVSVCKEVRLEPQSWPASAQYRPVAEGESDRLAARPNQRWVGDITEHPTAQGKLYLRTFKDLWSNRIVGYSMADRMTSALAIAAIRNAGLRRESKGVIVHTDRGSQFRARAFVPTSNDLGMVGSMGRVGACGDNASASPKLHA